MLICLDTAVRVVCSTPHHEYLFCVVYRLPFNEYYLGIHRGQIVQISHASLFCPYKSAISQRACRGSNYYRHVVYIECATRVSTRKHAEILHPNGFTP